VHSDAVDYAKNGKKPNLTGIKFASAYPDFMEKKDKESYESTTVLG